MAKHRNGGFHDPSTQDDSGAYSNIYDSRREDGDNRGRGNRGNQPEAAESVRLRAQLGDLERREAEASTEAANAPDQVHMLSIGKFIVPKLPDGEVDHSWAAQAALIDNEKNGLGFDPDKYGFDKKLAEAFPAIVKPENAQMLRNAVIMRNAIIGHYLREDESFDPGDEQYVAKVESIATAMGEALANNAWYKKLIFKSFDRGLFNVGEGVGAQEMYKYLLSMQDESHMFSGLTGNLKNLLDMPPRDWDLPQLWETPFSDANLGALPGGQKPPRVNAPAKITPAAPADLLKKAKAAVTPPPVAPAAPAEPATDSITERMIAASEKLSTTAGKLQSVDTMEEPPKAESVEEMRKFLRALKNWQYTDLSAEDLLKRGTPEVQLSKVEDLLHLVQLYARQLKDAVARQPELQHDATIEEANQAGAAIAWLVGEHVLGVAPDNHAKVPVLEALIDKLPDAAELQLSQSVEQLIEKLERGLERSSNTNISGKSAAERLMEIGKRITSTARQLRSVDSLEPPVREEAVERAREILRKWKVALGDQSIEAMMSAGKPEQRETFARQLDEMADIYKNLLQQAAQDNPDIIKDPGVQEITDTLGAFGHSVKLMAAKEMPNSIASAQQIGAEATQDPEEWKGRVGDRLRASMEGGLEKLDSLVTQQQEEQAEEQAQNIEAAVQEAQQESDRQKRSSKKRRRRGGGSSKSKKASSRKILGQMANRTNAFDLDGNGRLDELDGRGGIRITREEKKPSGQSASTGFKPNDPLAGQKTGRQANFMGLKAEDLAAALNAGGSLRDIGRQLKDISNPVSTVQSDDKIMPDDKTAAQRAIDAELQKRNKPNSPQIG